VDKVGQLINAIGINKMLSVLDELFGVIPIVLKV